MKTPPFLICFLRPERAACRDLLSFAQLQRKSFLSHKRHILFYQMIYVNDMHVSSLPSQSLLSVTFRLSKLLVFICVPTFHPDSCDKTHPSSFQASAGARPHLWPGRGFPLSQPLVSKRTPPFKHNSRTFSFSNNQLNFLFFYLKTGILSLVYELHTVTLCGFYLWVERRYVKETC